MLDRVGIQVLQLDLVMVQQPLEERVGRNHEPALMEGHEGHDVAVGRCRHLLTTGHEPLHRLSSPTEKTTLDEAIHARVGDVGAIPRLHGKQGWKNKNFAGGRRARTRNPGTGGGEAEKTRLRLRVPKGEGKGPYL